MQRQVQDIYSNTNLFEKNTNKKNIISIQTNSIFKHKFSIVNDRKPAWIFIFFQQQQ